MDGSRSLASAVALPDQDDTNTNTIPRQPSPDPTLKRRKSSISSPPPPDTDHSKRRRLSTDQRQQSPTEPEKTERAPRRQPPGKRDDERRRGQRLFGALLGTLSQGSSTSAAQRRRADIERKQQDKLKLQDEEYGELRKKRREERIAVRKREKWVYEEEVMRMRHSNLLATARFLKTRTEPVLYYKPWQLRSRDERIIQEQIEEAEATVAREKAEFDARPRIEEHENTQESVEPRDDREQHEQPTSGENESANKPEKKPENEPKVTSEEQKPEESKSEDNKKTEELQKESETGVDSHHGDIPEPANAGHDADIHRGAEDDGGEVVEDQEDTVIY